MSYTKPTLPFGRRLLRFALYTFLTLVGLVVLLSLALMLPAVQQKITREAQSWLHEKLGTRVEIGAMQLRFPYYISLDKFLLEDEKGDTLARVGSLVVDIDMWALLDQNIELKKITLEDASVWLHRRDSMYNFDFVTRAFANPNAPPPDPADTSASPWKLKLDLATLELKSVEFSLQDEDSKMAVSAKIGNASTVIKTADLPTLHFELSEFYLADSDIRMQQTKKTTPSGKPSDNFALLLEKAEILRSHLLFSTSELFLESTLAEASIENLQLQSLDDQLGVLIQKLLLKESKLTFRDPEAKSSPGHLNAGDLDLQDLVADISDFSFQNGTLALRAEALSGVDKSGLQLHWLRAELRMTPQQIEIANLDTEINQTTVKGDIALFKNEKATYDRMDIKIGEAKGIVGDLLLAMPPMESTKSLINLRDMPFDMTGEIVGSLNYLQTKNIELYTGNGTVVHLTGNLQRLTEPKTMGMNLQISRLETNRADLLRFMSIGGKPMDSLLASPLPAFFSAHGSLSGSLANMQISLEGNVGTLQTGVSPPPSTGQPLAFALAGNLSNVNTPDSLGMDLTLQRLEAPQSFFVFLEEKNIQMPDMLTATGTLKGTLAALLTDLEINALRGENNSRLLLDGWLKNLRSPDSLGFDIAFDAEVARQEILGYIPDTLLTRSVHLPAMTKLSGKAKGNVKNLAADATLTLGNWGNIRLDGTLRDTFYDATIVAKNLRVSQLAVDSALQPLKMLGFTAQVKGQGFEFGKTARAELAAKFDSVIWDNLVLRDIVLDAEVDGKKFKGLLKSPDERVAVHAQVSGDFGPAAPILDADIVFNCLDMREFGWAQRPTTTCLRIRSHSEGLSLDTLLAQATIEDIDLQYDTVHIRPGPLSLDIRLDNRQNRIVLESDWLQGELKGYFSIADLPETINNIAEQYFIVDRTNYVPPVGTDSLSVRIQFLKPQLLTTGLVPGLTKLSPLNLEASLDARRNFFEFKAQVPRMAYLDWSLDSLNARAYAGDSAAVFLVSSPLIRRQDETFVENARVSGRFVSNIANVAIAARDAEGRERFRLAANAELSRGARTATVRLDPVQIIDFHEWQVDPGNKIQVAAKTIEIEKLMMRGNGQSVGIEGSTRVLASGRTGLDFEVDISRLNFQNFDVFLGQYVRELDGWLQADMNIKGTTDALQVRGTMQLHNTVVTPTLTNVRYELSETPLEFTAEGINLNGLTLRDPAGKTLEIKGKLATTDWKTIRADLQLHADRWQALNTMRQDNPTYFGRVFVTLNGSVRGLLTEPDIQINVKTAKESDFTYIYDAATQSAQHEGIVEFVPPARAYVRPLVYDAPATRSPITLSASIEIDSNLNINSVVNPVTGDDFNGKANGRLQLDLFPNGNMTLSGRVELVRGIYRYSYQSVVKRSFEVARGSSIVWSGDVASPELQLKARYVFQASPYPLVVNQLPGATGDETSQYRKRQTFILQTSVNGTPKQPDVGFKFIYPPDEQQEGISQNFGNQEEGLVRSALNNVNDDPNLMSRQIFGVLLFKNFIGESIGATTTSSGGDPLRAGLSSFLTSQVNALAQQYLTFIDVEVEAKDAASNDGASSAEGTTNYQLRLEKSFFEDRLTFKLSGGTTVGGANGDEVQSALENASVEYAVTRNGGLKVTVFSEKGFELLNASSSNLRNSGAGIIVSKEFNGKRKKS
ncbi:MAG: translocation/assembly module TamB domain-containing protein [Saprospiraceae bacterium]